MALGDTIFEPELIEKAALIPPLPPHHSPRPPRPMIDQSPESRFAGLLKSFFNSIDQRPPRLRALESIKRCPQLLQFEPCWRSTEAGLFRDSCTAPNDDAADCRL